MSFLLLFLFFLPDDGALVEVKGYGLLVLTLHTADIRVVFFLSFDLE